MPPTTSLPSVRSTPVKVTKTVKVSQVSSNAYHAAPRARSNKAPARDSIDGFERIPVKYLQPGRLPSAINTADYGFVTVTVDHQPATATPISRTSAATDSTSGTTSAKMHDDLPELPNWVIGILAGMLSFGLVVAVVLYFANFPPEWEWLHDARKILSRRNQRGYTRIDDSDEENDSEAGNKRGADNRRKAAGLGISLSSTTALGGIAARRRKNLSVDTSGRYGGLGIAVHGDRNLEVLKEQRWWRRRSFDEEKLRHREPPPLSPARFAWEAFTAPIPSIATFSAMLGGAGPTVGDGLSYTSESDLNSVTEMKSACIIYINGYPGVGQMTVAKALQRFIPGSKILHNHELTDPTARHFSSKHPQCQQRRGEDRRQRLKRIMSDSTLRDTVFILTHSRTEHNECMADYADVALGEHCRRFYTVVLHCEQTENDSKLMMADRGSQENGKLTNVNALRGLQERGGGSWKSEDDDEMKLDVTSMPPDEAARRIVAFVQRREEEGRCPSSDTALSSMVLESQADDAAAEMIVAHDKSANVFNRIGETVEHAVEKLGGLLSDVADGDPEEGLLLPVRMSERERGYEPGMRIAG